MGADRVLNIQDEWRVFDLDGIDVGDLAGASQSAGADLGQADVLDLALPCI